MFSKSDLVSIFFPVFSHWIIWVAFLVVSGGALFLYAYPYIRTPRKEFLRRHIGIPIVSVASLYTFTKLLEGVIYNGAILKVDVWINESVVGLRTPFMNKLAFFITSFGGGYLIVVIVIVTIGILFLMKRWRFALLSLTAIIGATLLQVLIKALVNRPRPPNMLKTISDGSFSASFPSGHAITAIVYVSLLIYSYRDDIKHVGTKYLLITLASAFFITVGLTRIYLGVHWFSDVLAGMTLGLFWFMTVVLVERSITGLVKAVRIETKEAAEDPALPKIIPKIEKALKK